MLQNTIAAIFDSDLTLTPSYMERYVFEKFGIKEADLWAESESLAQSSRKNNKKNVPGENAYMHLICEKAKKGGQFDGLTEKVLFELGQKMEFFPGIPEFFERIKKEIEDNPKYRRYGITVECYISSGGLKDMLRGSVIAPHMEYIDACEFFYDKDGVPTGIARAVTPTQKTQLLFNIGKGLIKDGVIEDEDIDVDASMPYEIRRVPMCNMLYFGDGPSDVPCMSVLKKYGGFTFAVYNPKSVYKEHEKDPIKNAFELKTGGRADFCVQTNYNEGSDLHMLTVKVLRTIADSIIKKHKQIIMSAAGKALKQADE